MSSQPIASRRTLLSGVLGATALGATLAAANGQSAAAVSVPTGAEGKFFLDLLPTIKGESVSESYRETIELLDWSVGVDNPARVGGGGGGGSRASRPVPRPFTAIARSSIASPKLFAAAAQGTRLPRARLIGIRDGGESQVEYLVITLDNVQVTSYGMAPDDTDATPTDIFEMVYGRLTMSWTPQNNDGASGTPIVTSFDFERGRA